MQGVPLAQRNRSVDIRQTSHQHPDFLDLPQPISPVLIYIFKTFKLINNPAQITECMSPPASRQYDKAPGPPVGLTARTLTAGATSDADIILIAF